MPPPPDFKGATENGRFSLIVPTGVVARIMTACRAAKPLETGGIVVGVYSSDHHIARVTDVSGPPQDSTYGPTWLLRGVRGLRHWLGELWHRQGQYYLGEWHFHPGGTAEPSSTDIEQMKRISSDLKYRCPEPLLIIIGERLENIWEFQAWVFPRDLNPQEFLHQGNDSVDTGEVAEQMHYEA